MQEYTISVRPKSHFFAVARQHDVAAFKCLQHMLFFCIARQGAVSAIYKIDPQFYTIRANMTVIGQRADTVDTLGTLIHWRHIQLRQAVIGRLRRGEIQPQRIDPQIGQPYPGLDWSVQHPEGNGEVVNVGRVPGYPEYQVYRASDGQLWVFSPQELEERMEATRAAAGGLQQEQQPQ